MMPITLYTAMAVSNFLARFTSNKQQNIVGLFISTHKVVIGAIQSGRLHVESLDVGSDPWLTAKQLIQKLALSKISVNIVLGHNLYQGLLIDDPNLSDQDKHFALPFKIKDFISDPPTDVIADGYKMPIANRFQVFVTRKSDVVAFANFLAEHQCKLNLVTVESVALKQWTQEDKTEMVITNDGQGALLLSVFSCGKLCFQRQVRGLALDSVNLPDEVVDELALEIQRSLDYIKTQLKAVQVTGLVVAVENISNSDLALQLSSRLGVAVRPQLAFEQGEPYRHIIKAHMDQSIAHDINLFYEGLLPKQAWLSFDKMFATWGCVALLLAGVAGYQHWQLKQTERVLETFTTELSISQRLFNELQERLKLHVPSLALVNEVELAEKKINSQRLALDAVSQHDEALQQGYASTMQSFAHLARPDISIDSFFVSLNRLDVHGEAANPDDVPSWVQTFQTEPALAKREFEQMEIYRDDKQGLFFRLISQREVVKGRTR